MKLSAPAFKAFGFSVLGLTFFGFASAQAVTLLWDAQLGTAGVQDGTGAWNDSSLSWYNAQSSSSQGWGAGSDQVASFGSGTSSTTTKYTVTLSAPMSANGLIFNHTGDIQYQLSGTNTLTLAGSTGEGEAVMAPTVQLNAKNAFLNVSLQGQHGFVLNAVKVLEAVENRLTLEGAQANTLTGTIELKSGELGLNKTVGVNAIASDVVINGGTLRWLANNQVADTASITLNSGTLYLSGRTETIKNLTINGGENNGGTGSNGGTFTVNDTLTLGGLGKLGLNSAAQWTINRVVLEERVGFNGDSGISVTGNSGSASIEGSVSTLQIGSGGLEMYNRTITLNTGNTDNPYARGSQVILGGNVLSSGNAAISKGGGFFGVGHLDLNGGVREWDVQSGTTTIYVSILGAGNSELVKKGAGTLSLNSANATTQHEANTYTGMTTVEAGVLKLAKNAGYDAIAGDITVKNNAVLDWDRANQIKDTSSIYLEGGSLKLDNLTETVANIYINGGTLNNAGNTNGGQFTVTGVVQLKSGSDILLNSGGMWEVNRFETESSKTGAAISLSGNSSINMNRFAIGSGGMKLTGQNVTLSRAALEAAFGSELVLGGDFEGSGTNSINQSSAAHGTAQVNLLGSQRVFNIVNGTTNINAKLMSSTITLTNVGTTATAGGIIKRGTGTLQLSQEVTYTGNTRVEGGTLRVTNNARLHTTPRISVLSGATLDVSSLAGGHNFLMGQTLEGGGQILGSVTMENGATLSVGTLEADPTQQLSFNAGLTLKSGSLTLMDLGNLGDNDKLSVSGAFLQETGAKITIFTNGSSLTDGSVFQLFTGAGSKTFSGNLGQLLRTGAEDGAWDFDLPDISSSGLWWDLSNLQSLGSVAVVPEPQKAFLSMLALAFLGFRRSRK